MEKTLSRQARAKINLYLRVTGKRPDGYHELESIMQSVSLADTVTVSCGMSACGKSITLTCTDHSVPCDGRNIAVKCAEKFFDKFGINDYSVKIHIKKNIPVSGGLAGGSTDGAAVLCILNELCGTGASVEDLCSLGASVGADIPFCVLGGTALCTGIGDVLMPLRIPVPEYSVLIVSPSGGVSTPEAYSAIDRAGEIPQTCSSDSIISVLQSGGVPKVMHNDFEAVILPVNENAALVKKLLLDNGADSAMMSGSGPTVFALFSDAEKCAEAAKKIRSRGFTCRECTVSR